MPPPPEYSARSNFPTTRWTLVLQASLGGGGGPAADEEVVRAAQQSLCSDYRGPVVAFALACGVPAADAEDIAHDFFVRFLGGDGFGNADQAKGKLRTYLLAALKNTIRNYFRSKRAGKRGGGHETLPLEQVAEIAGGEDQGEKQPTHAYDRAWAENLMDRALEAVLESRGWRKKATLFADLVPLIDGTGDGPTVRRQICERHGLDADALTNQLFRLRRRLRIEVRVLISATVETEEEVDEELRYLARLLAE